MAISDRLLTQLQETGMMPIIGLSPLEVIQALDTLGMDPALAQFTGDGYIRADARVRIDEPFDIGRCPGCQNQSPDQPGGCEHLIGCPNA